MTTYIQGGGSKKYVDDLTPYSFIKIKNFNELLSTAFT